MMITTALKTHSYAQQCNSTANELLLSSHLTFYICLKKILTSDLLSFYLVVPYQIAALDCIQL